MKFLKGIKEDLSNGNVVSSIFEIANQRLNRDQRMQSGNEQAKSGQKTQQKSLSNEHRFWKVVESPEYETSPEDALTFVSNICEFTSQERKSSMKVRHSPFDTMQISPIYTRQQVNDRILKLELEMSSSKQQLLERTKNLTFEQSKVTSAIEFVLFSGYLREANRIDLILQSLYSEPSDNYFAHQYQFLKQCQKVIICTHQTICKISDQIISQRTQLKVIWNHLNAMLSAKKHRQEIKRNLSLLSKIKNYYHDLSQTIQNIDQAFYMQRNRQKMYNALLRNDGLVSRVLILQRLREKIVNISRQVIQLCKRELVRWIDMGQSLQPKHKQKLFILIYFIRNEDMYTQNGLTIKLNHSIRDTPKLRSEIQQIQNWDQYKYVNNTTISGQVKLFLARLMIEIEGPAD